MKRKAICSRCKTGKNTLLLDPREPECPYLARCGNGSCPFYRRLENTKETQATKQNGRKISLFSP